MLLSVTTSKGLQGVAAGANPSLVSGRGQGAPWTSVQEMIEQNKDNSVCVCVCVLIGYPLLLLLHELTD